MKSGEEYIFSELANQLIAGQFGADQLTVYSIVSGHARKVGAQRMPDVTDIIKRTAAAIGSADFPALSVAQHRPRENARVALNRWWSIISRMFDSPELRDLNPFYRTFSLATATGELIEAVSGVLDPEVALVLVLETAIAMSKVTGIRDGTSSVSASP